MKTKRDNASRRPPGWLDCLGRRIERVAFVDDDETRRSQWLEWAKMKGVDAKAFDSAYEANQYRADAYVFDVSSVSPNWVGLHAYAPIARLMQDHPGATVIVGSMMSRRAVEDVLDDIEDACGGRPIFYDAANGYAGLNEVLRQPTAKGEPPGVNQES